MRHYFDKDEKPNTNFMRRTARYHTLKQLNLKMAFEGLNGFNKKESSLLKFDDDQPTSTAKKGFGFRSKLSPKKTETSNNIDKPKAINIETTSKKLRKTHDNLRNSVRTKAHTNTSLPYVSLNLNDKKTFEKSVKKKEKKNNEKITKFNDSVTKTIFTGTKNNYLNQKSGPLIQTTSYITKPSGTTIKVTKTESQPLKSTIIHSASGRLYNLGKKIEENNKNKNSDNTNTQIHNQNFSKYESRVSNRELRFKVNEGEKSKAKLFEEKRESRRRTTNLKRRATKEYEEFNTNMYTKFCDATSTAGRDDDGKKKTNQDTFVLEKNINGVINFNIFGVLDGHGVNGHYASNFTKKYMLDRIKNHPLIKNLQTPNEIYKQLTMNGYQILAKMFVDADIQIAKEKFNVEMSGTTCVIVIQLGERLICANAGDSRAILVYEEKNSFNLSNTKIFMLSYDCKPEIPLEKKRIEANGGVVSQIIDEEDNQPSGPFRVWVKGEAYPGIAISRSIGDMDAKKVGVIPNPQIIEYTLTPQSKYMIICSDGIWEYLSNEEVMEFAKNYYIKSDPLTLCKELTKKSTEFWLEDDVVVDDITVVAVFF